MMNVTKKRMRTEKRARRIITLGGLAGILFFCAFFFFSLKSSMLRQRIGYQVCILILRQMVPNLSVGLEAEEDSESVYETATESGLDYDTVLAENVTAKNAQGDVSAGDGQGGNASGEAASDDGQIAQTAEDAALAGGQDADGETGAQETSAEAVATVNLEKLNDFDYLIQNFYTVDSMTTINSSQLSASELLSRDCGLAKRADDEPQILIYHTHASEGYCDSVSGDLSTTVVGVGEKLAQLLTETYGYHVLHDTGVYDTDRNRAYSVAAPYVEQILEEYPSIEVVIDLHRDGVSEGTRLVTVQNGVSMAQVMFFNGLSRTTAMGDIDYLYNPYITDNLAFSLQLKIKATELYPDFARKIYLKGYRYNMHFCPKSLLVEVGAQTNTLEEAMNAMGPLAQILDAVLSGS